DAALELDHGGPGRPQLLDEIVGGRLRLEDIAAGEHVDGGVAVFRPSVNGEVRLGNNDDATDAERIELVENHIHDGRLRTLGRLDHGRLHGLEAVERFRVAVEQLEQQVSPQCLHSLPPFRSSLARKNSASMFFECRAMFLALQGKNGLSDGSPRSREHGPGRAGRLARGVCKRRGAAKRLSEVTFLLAFSLRAANMVERFFSATSTLGRATEETRANGLETGDQGSDDVRKR